MPQVERKQTDEAFSFSACILRTGTLMVCLCPAPHPSTNPCGANAAEAPGGWHPNPELQRLRTWLQALLHNVVISKDVT